VLAAGSLAAIVMVVGLAVARPAPLPATLDVSLAVVPAGVEASVSVVLTPLASDIAEAQRRAVVRAGGDQVFDELVPGVYEFSVFLPVDGVDVSGLTCEPAAVLDAVDPDAQSAVIRLDSGSDVACTVTGVQRGEVVVKHVTRPSSTRDFTFTPSWGPAFPLAHKQSATSPPLEPGAYSVAAAAPGAWDTSKARCDDGSRPDDITVDPGETVMCAFTSTRRGSVTVRTQTVPAGAEASVAVNPSWGKKFSLADGKKRTSPRLVPGEYALKARAPERWDVTGSTCDDDSTLASVSLSPDEKVTCTVTITQRGRVVVVHEPDAPTSEPFTVSTSFGDDVTLEGAGSWESRWLEPGEYSAALETPSGWAGTGATCNDGSDPDAIFVGPGETVTCTFASTQPRFTVASFNVLGHSHTQPGGRVPSYASGPQRMSWTLEQLRTYGVDIVGFQEFQRPQMDAFERLGGSDFDLYPPPGLDQRNKQNAIAWRSSKFTLVQGRPIMTPYFRGNRVPMPLVRLRHNQTGLDVYVMTVHNPASVRRVGDQSRWRQAATAQQIALTNQLLAEGVPVLMTGDMNERERYFCAYTGGTAMRAAAGGSTGAGCRPPPSSIARIDWIFGSPDIEFLDYRFVKNSAVSRISDHPLIVADAVLQ
jgi:endonuclease/exonuclease/phosphatase family metal-dependent hydrolase/plastocyanin